MLLFAPADESPESDSSTEAAMTLSVVASPKQRYYALSPEDRIAILSFMCNLAISSKAIHAHMDSCEEQLTALRKEKIEVNRQKKQ